MDSNTKEVCKCCTFKKNSYGKISKPTNKSKLKKYLKKYDDFLTKKIEDIQEEINELLELTICECDNC